MRNEKRDRNEPAIVQSLQNGGLIVERLPGGKGRPDLIAANPHTKKMVFVEVKVPGEKLNDLQREFHKRWPTKIIIAEYPSAALVAVLEATR